VDAVSVAKDAALSTAGVGHVGEHLGYEVEGDRVVTHQFECTAPGYVGWRWSVTLARASRAKTVTVSECVLLPGPDAILAEAWVPWGERVEPTDLGPGDLMPTTDDDPRLAPGYTGADESIDPLEVKDVLDELGLANPWVLSREGRDTTATRWHTGEHGPDTEIAQSAPASCETCAFMIRLGGSLGRVFGACANERAPFDGQVVSYDHGCGAHSDVRVDSDEAELPPPVFDTVSYDVVTDDDGDG
jgi:hypothetical protein